MSKPLSIAIVGIDGGSGSQRVAAIQMTLTSCSTRTRGRNGRAPVSATLKLPSGDANVRYESKADV